MSRSSDEDEEIVDTATGPCTYEMEEEKMSNNSSDDDEETLDDTPSESNESNRVALLPAKSRERYQAVYEAFMQWKTEKKVRRITENVILEYFCELAKKYKPPTLWSTYSMLRCTLNIHDKIHLERFKHLSAFLKIKSSGYQGRQSKTFTATDIENFLDTAPDRQYLATKVVLIFGISGACQSSELLKLTTNDIMDRGDVMVVKLRDRNAKTARSFIIEGEYLKKTMAYQALRPNNTTTDRFFINYQEGRCTNQAIGKNKLGRMPREIAKFLKLPEPEQYTGHSFRRSSTTTANQVCADEEIPINTGERIEIQRLGGWSTVTEGFMDESVGFKRKTSEHISPAIDESSMNSVTFDEEPTKRIKMEVFDTQETSPPTTSQTIDKVHTETTTIDWHGRTVSLQFTNCSTVNIKFVH